MNRKIVLITLLIVCGLMSLSHMESFAFFSGEPASVVLGQTNFTSSGHGVSTTDEYGPGGIAIDSSGNLWVADSGNNRVIQYAFPISTDEPASMVLGQSDCGSNSAGLSSIALNNPEGLAFDPSGNLWVADASNNRVLEFTYPFSKGEAASTVLGQPDFTSDSSATTSSGLDSPNGIAVDSSGNVWVADFHNNRVLEYVKGQCGCANGFSNGQAASLVLGQKDFVSAAEQTAQKGMFSPIGLAFDSSGNLWVADFGNSRVLEFDRGTGFTSDQPASLVLGQTSFTSLVIGGTATGLQNPTYLTVSSR